MNELLNDKLKSRYHTIVGKLLFLAKWTWSDILTAVSVLWSRINDPSDKDLDHAYRIIRYLSSTIGYGLCFHGNLKINHLTAYCDAEFGIDDKYCSRTGIIIMSCGAPML